jgi:NAD(P)H-quinone oxidoreductase subunit I
LEFKRYGNGIAKGMALTFKHLFRKPITTQYPEERLDVSRRTRGSQLIWNRDTCIACSACARACPVGCIDIVTSRGDDNKLRVDDISIDFGQCIFCGLCVEACPIGDVLYMSYNWEYAEYQRQKLVLSNDELLPSVKRQPSGYNHPEVEKNLPEQTLLLYRPGRGKPWD